jgi:tetratricopeptide (TPR) repeat protein
VRFDLSLSYANLGDVSTLAGDAEGALENYRKSLSMRQALLAQEPANLKYRRSIAALYYRMAPLIYERGDKAGSISTASESLAMFEEISRESPQNSKAQRELALAHNNLGDLLWYNSDLKGAMENYRRGLLMREELLKTDPTNMQAQRDLAVSYANYGYTLAQVGNPEGLALYRKNLEMIEGLLAANPDNANSLRDVAINYSFCADAYGLMASRTELPVEKRVEYYRSAINFNQRSLKVWEDMRGRGWLRSRDTATPGKIALSISGYEKAIAQLKK